jgi:hypothetical protein
MTLAPLDPKKLAKEPFVWQLLFERKRQNVFQLAPECKRAGNTAIERALETDLERLYPPPSRQFDISIKGHSNTAEVVIQVRREYPFLDVSSFLEDFSNADERRAILQRVAELVEAFNEEEG